VDLQKAKKIEVTWNSLKFNWFYYTAPKSYSNKQNTKFNYFYQYNIYTKTLTNLSTRINTISIKRSQHNISHNTILKL
jgi:hypothetical protein